VALLYRLYDRPGPNAMSFDLFVQSCISLKRMTDMFKKHDTDRDGYVTLSFEEFLTGTFMGMRCGAVRLDVVYVCVWLRRRRGWRARERGAWWDVEKRRR
jgi:hypothetical protein